MKVEIIKWCIPFFGNNHTMPYGTIRVTEGDYVQICKTKGDTIGEYNPYIGQYITFNRKRYKVINKGTLYSPKLELIAINKK